MKRTTLCISAVLALSCVSCGNGLYPVSGKVMYKGQPAAGAAVFFLRQGADPMNEPMIMGCVQKDGCFTLVCGSQGSGAPPGEYEVLIEWKDRANRGKGGARSLPDKLRGRYADRLHPVLHASIKPKPNNLPPFELTD